MTGWFVVLLGYACAVTYSYVHIHHKYGRTHVVLAMFWPIVACFIGTGRLARAVVEHFTKDGRQFGQ